MEATSVERREGLEKLRTFLSPYAGVVPWAEEVLSEPFDARLTFMVCEIAPRTLTLDSPFPMASGSAAYTREDALGAALGEAVERYSGSFLPESELVLATAEELGPKAVSPERFTLYSERQYAHEAFRFRPFTSETKVNWVKGWSIPDGEEAWLPQQLVFMRSLWSAPPEGETPIGIGSSSGMSLGVSREDALLGGLLEVVERDAIMLTWLNRLGLPHLDWSRDPDLVALDEAHFAPSGLPFDVIDISAWCNVPTALAIHSAGNGPVPYAMGAASDVTIQKAWDKAVRECFQGLMMLKSSDGGTSFADDFSDVTSPEDHSVLYLDREMVRNAAFLESSDEVREVSRVPALEGEGQTDWVEAIARRLDDVGASAYAVDITTPDVREAGLHVVKAICPELQPIDFVHFERFLGGPRLYEAAFELGLRDAPMTPDQLNPYPHPFP